MAARRLPGARMTEPESLLTIVINGKTVQVAVKPQTTVRIALIAAIRAGGFLVRKGDRWSVREGDFPYELLPTERGLGRRVVFAFLDVPGGIGKVVV